MRWKMKDEKIVGYVLLAVGLVLIFFSIFQMVQVFGGANPPPNLFNFSDIRFPLPEQDEMVTVMSGEELSKIADLSMWYLLMFFVMWAGGKIASLGVNLIKETKMEAKGRKEKEIEKAEEEKSA
jgi:hypothetical protein